MLLGKHFRRSHDAGLITVSDGYQCAEHSHHGLSAAHISLQQAVHLMSAPEVLPYLLYHPLLGACKREGECIITSIERFADTAHGYSLVVSASYIFLFEK